MASLPLWAEEGEPTMSEASVRLYAPDPPTTGSGGRSRGPSTVAELVDQYLARIKRKIGARTYAERERLLLQYRAHAGDSLISELIPDDLQSYLDSHTEWASDWTLHGVCGILKLPFSWADGLGLIARNPFRSVTHPTGARGRPMEEGHYEQMIAAATEAFRPVMIFMHQTGARPCEVSSIMWEHIDGELGTVTLHVHKTARTRKDKEPRVIYLDQVAIDLLVDLKQKARPNQKHVFVNSRGRPWTRSSLSLAIQRLRKRAGVPAGVKLYGLRHAFATRLASAGVELKTLSTLMGHTTTRQTEHYIHMAGKTSHLRAELERGLKGERK